MSAYRTPAEIAAEIPPSPKLRARTMLAKAIVAPVRLVQWCWPWLVANLMLNTILFGAWALAPRLAIVVGIAANALAGIGWAAILAYRWATRELEAAQGRRNDR